MESSFWKIARIIWGGVTIRSCVVPDLVAAGRLPVESEAQTF